MNIPTGISRYGDKGEQLFIPNDIKKLVIVVMDVKEHTAMQHTDKIWLIKICHAIFFEFVTDEFRQMNCTEVVFNFGKIALEHEYRFNLLKHLPRKVEKITIMNFMGYVLKQFDEYENIKSLHLVNCPHIREIYNNVLQTDIEEVIIQDGVILKDEHHFSNSKIMLRYRETEMVAKPEKPPTTGLHRLPQIPTHHLSQPNQNASYVQNYWSAKQPVVENRGSAMQPVVENIGSAMQNRYRHGNNVSNSYSNNFW
jgi:hypothetical protein